MKYSSNKNSVAIEVRVAYYDTDQMGVAHHAAYLRWLEQGRSEWFRSKGLPYKVVEKRGILFPVVDIACHYEAPARYDELLLVNTELAAVGHASILFRYSIKRGEEELAWAESRHACLNRQGKVRRLPMDVADLIRRALEKPGEQGVPGATNPVASRRR